MDELDPMPKQRLKKKQNKLKTWQTPLDPKRLEFQRTVVKVQGLTKKQWDNMVKLARGREIIWRDSDIVEKEQERMSDYLEIS